jgi:type I restriction enzyme S subunit
VREDETLPAGWATAKLPELIGPDGLFVDGDWVESKDQNPDGDVRLIQLADVGDGEYLNKSARFLTGDAARRLRCTFLESGDVLIARMPEPLGRACMFPGDPMPSVTVVDVCVVRTAMPSVDHRWLVWAVNAPQFRVAVESLQSGSTRKRISRLNLATLELPVPPPSEQRRIVAALEQQLSRIDAGVAALERAKANLERYRASVLKAACEGRLVPTEAELARAEGRTYEPASELLARILEQRRERWEADQLARMKARGKPPKDDAWKKKYPEPAAPDTSALPELPEGWCWATVEQLARRVTKGTTPTSLGFAFTDAGVRFVKVESLVGGQINHGLCAFIGDDANDALERSRLEAGDVLVSIAGTLGRVAVVSQADLPANTNQALAIIRLVEPSMSSFIRSALTSPSAGDQVEGLRRGVGLENLNLEQVSSLLLPVPPRSEQARIVAKIDQLISTRDAAAADLGSAHARASRLRQSLLAHAFSGKLVPQDPTDEPASVLLERIRKEREAAAAEKPKQPARRGSPQRGPRKTAPKGPR